MVQNVPRGDQTADILRLALGEDISDAELANLQSQLKISAVAPGAPFWQSTGGEAGLFVVLSGKVRLFDLYGERRSSLPEGKLFGAGSLFPELNAAEYNAKAAAVLVGSGEVMVGFLSAKTLGPLLSKSRSFETFLRDHAEYEDRVIRGEEVPTIINRANNRGVGVYAGTNGPPAALSVEAKAPVVGKAPKAAVERPEEKKLAKDYFPTPNERLGQWWKKLTHNYPFYAQQSSADCSAACLVMVGRFWGKEFNINRLRELAYVSRDGASLKGLANAAEKLGFNARPVKASLDLLAKQQLPAIAHWEGKHYIVVYEITPNRVIVCDPAIGQRSLTHEEFKKDWTNYCLLLEPTIAIKNADQKSTVLWQLFSLIIPHKVVIAEIFLASIILQLFGIVLPIFTQLILDRAVAQRSADSLTTFGVGLLLFGFFQILMVALRQYLMSVTVNRIDAALVIGFIRHTFSLPLSYFDARHVGDIISRVEENHKIQRFITGQSLGVILDLLSVFVYGTLMFVYSWKLALATLISIPPFLILNFGSTPFLQRISREIFNVSTAESSYLIEALNGVRTVKSMSVEQPVRWKWEDLLNKEIKQVFRGQMLGIKLQMTSSAINTISSTALTWIGASLVMANEFTLGQLFAFNMISGNVIGPFQRLASIWVELQEITIAIERLCDVIEATPEETATSGRVGIGRLKGHVRFENVTFRYQKDADTNILENINFEIKPGQTIALVGRSGSGKTTLAKIILGLYMPTTGKVAIDGRDLTTVSLHSLRSQVGVVDQDTFLFSGTIKDNIAIAKPNVTQEEMEKAATLAGAHEFISKMPMAYETEIGEGGGMLSGGQRQRLAIARALISNPRLLVFDEATSSLDTESERIIQGNLEKIGRDRSMIIIAHRLSTVRKADVILVLDKGVLIESGSHEQLMSKKGQYYYLTQQQLGTLVE
jgi:HlyB family type I secretion system ABC transporter